MPVASFTSSEEKWQLTSFYYVYRTRTIVIWNDLVNSSIGYFLIHASQHCGDSQPPTTLTNSDDPNSSLLHSYLLLLNFGIDQQNNDHL